VNVVWSVDLICGLVAIGLVLGTLYVGGYMMSQNEVTAGDLMSFMVATQTIQRFGYAVVILSLLL